MIMTGFNPKYGAFETKADRKLNLINALKKYDADLERYTDPSFHVCKSIMASYLRVERALITEYGMTEEEIYTAINA